MSSSLLLGDHYTGGSSVTEVGEGSDVVESRGTEHGVSFRESFWVWVKVAIYSFGGPAGQIAAMHKLLVEQKRWISENRFLHAMNYTMLLPGPEAQQLTIYIGWLLHKAKGGIVAGVLFVIPGFVSILILSILYAVYSQVPIVNALFFGLKAAVLAVVIEAVLRIGRRTVKNQVMVGVAAAAFVGIFFFQVPFPFITPVAGVLGYVGGQGAPETVVVIKEREVGDEVDFDEPVISTGFQQHTQPSKRRAIRVAAVWLTIWFAPLLILIPLFGLSSVYVTEAIFFSKTAVVTFGGAYAVLAYIAQQAVQTYGWLAPREMLDGLGMAETTPGPLIQVVQFVGFMGAYRNPGPFEPLVAGIVGSVITTWFTFALCFLWIFLGAPYIEHFRGRESLTGALSTITAVVVGVVLNLAVWFALHVLFGTLNEQSVYGMRLLVPEFATLNGAALLISLGALVALLRFEWGMLKTLGTATLAGMLYQVFLVG